MSVDSKTEEKNRPRLLGDYLPCSDGSIRIAMQKKRDAKLPKTITLGFQYWLHEGT